MIHLLKKWSLVSVCVLTLISSCTKSSDDEQQKIAEFLKLRESGNTAEVWKILSDKSREVFSYKEFEEYCFIYKVSETLEIKKTGDYFTVRYNFYDKKFKKDSQELYTFYIRENIEHIRIGETGIIFPYTGYLSLRRAVEKGDMKEVDNALKKMIKDDSSNPDVLKSVKDMGSSGH